MTTYNTIIIGGGPAGYHAALMLAKFDKTVALFEKHKVGGVCLHEGCIPTKTFLKNAKIYYEITKDNGQLYNHEVTMNNKSSVVNSLYKGLSNRIKHAGVILQYGEAKIVGKQNLLFEVALDGNTYYAEHVIVATGSRNKIPDISGLTEAIENNNAIFSTEFLDMSSISESITIIGGGVVGVEFATFLAEIGTDVTIIEGFGEILNETFDLEVIELIKNDLLNKGVKIITNALVEEIDANSVIYSVNGDYDEVSAEKIIVACGRIGNVEQLGLEMIGVKTNKNFIVVDEYCQTNIDGIYACGDINGCFMLAHIAYKEAEVAVNNIINNRMQMKYNAVPSVVFTNPEAASAGLTEQQCQTNNIRYYVKSCGMNYSSRFLIEAGSSQGICKLLFNEKDILIGGQIVGNGAAELIFPLADMIAQEEDIYSIQNKIYPHPSICEVIKEAVTL